ncbi:hypothetical protein E0H35_06260 [Rhizobium leguminosarum bv. viciae]|nr:hypothetical protein [Rhizobium leguminosarum]NKK50847.1 hypothetical protein [Rhizobium leguminosarum bv. viciae]TBG74710.1 hypothetical protein ELG69_29460 [Rhizobium leguminosarum]TBZ02752.1 hypothetical protein E0H35_06260 [Rhizobium leguminosarum bv. viciae]
MRSLPVIARPFDAGRIAAVPALFCGCLAASIRTGAITPLLGGVGPMTITRLMHNTLIAASMRSGRGFRCFGRRDTPYNADMAPASHARSVRQARLGHFNSCDK